MREYKIGFLFSLAQSSFFFFSFTTNWKADTDKLREREREREREEMMIKYLSSSSCSHSSLTHSNIDGQSTTSTTQRVIRLTAMREWKKRRRREDNWAYSNTQTLTVSQSPPLFPIFHHHHILQCNAKPIVPVL